jgi:hypothetical protein
MAPAANAKANYKTYEAQARMVRAIVAAHPEVKWNYKGKTIFLYLYSIFFSVIILCL